MAAIASITGIGPGNPNIALQLTGTRLQGSFVATQARTSS